MSITPTKRVIELVYQLFGNIYSPYQILDYYQFVCSF